MDYSTISNKTNYTETEDVTNGELAERYYLLKKQHDSLTLNFEAMKQDLHDTRRSYQTALDVQSHLTAEIESHQADEAKRRLELTSRITSLQEEISSLRTERADTLERHSSEINRLESEIQRLKVDTATQETCKSPVRDTAELDEMRGALAASIAETDAVKEALEGARTEIASWQLRGEALITEIEQLKEAAEIRREELRSMNEREAVALGDLAEARAMLHQYTASTQDLEPHAAKGNSLFAEVEDKRQEMAKTLIQMKQTNSKLRRDLANKQVELDTLLHEKQTIWEQQVGAAAHHDRELIEKYEERISQLEALTERQRRELARWFGKHADPAAHGWLPAVLDHLKSECEKLRAEVLSKGAAQLASAVQVRGLRRQLASLSSGNPKPSSVTKLSPPVLVTNTVMRDITNNTQSKLDRMTLPAKVQENVVPQVKTVDDVKKRVTFN